MTPTDLSLIRATLGAVAKNPDSFAHEFCQTAVALDRTLETLVPPLAPRQARRIVDTLAHVLDGLDGGECQAATARAWSLRHHWAGIQPRHYATVGQALLEALSQALGEGFTDDARAAWATAFVLFAEAFMARSYNPLGLAA